jgi:hypothetical protein
MVFLRISQNVCTFGLRISETFEEKLGTGNITHPAFLMVQVTSTPQLKSPNIGVVQNPKFDSIRVEGCNKAH